MFCGKRALSSGSSSTAQTSRSFAVLQTRSINSSVLGSLVQHTVRVTFKIQTLTMNFSSLNPDVLLYLMGFVTPVDRSFNLVLSGVLKGFENVNEGMDLRERYSGHFTCDVSDN